MAKTSDVMMEKFIFFSNHEFFFELCVIIFFET